MPHPDYHYRCSVAAACAGAGSGTFRGGPAGPRRSRDGALLAHVEADARYWHARLPKEREALRRRGKRYRRPDDLASEVAALLDAGDIVAWFQGRMEWGPRALGNRSLLGDPRRPELREILNVKVKHREEFRPFCPSVLASEASQWFDVPGEENESTDYMLCACPTPPEHAKLIPAAVHVDGTARIQTVTDEANPAFAELLRRFEERTGVPIIINTSFNDSEPIVCSPDDAITTFEGTRIDHLALGPFIVSAEQPPDQATKEEA